MKKIVMLSAVVMLSLSGMTISQAETASATAPAKKESKVPQDPPHVQKLVALYPNLIARIAPQGRVCFEGQECDINITPPLGAADENNPREGKVIYEAVCQTCHASGLLNSPKFGDKGAWSARLGKGVATLHNNAINGIGAMPAKGGNAELLDIEVKNAVDYILENSK